MDFGPKSVALGFGTELHHDTLRGTSGYVSKSGNLARKTKLLPGPSDAVLFRLVILPWLGYYVDDQRGTTLEDQVGLSLATLFRVRILK